MERKRVVVLGIGVFFVLVFTSLFLLVGGITYSTAAAPAKTLKIGAVMTLTGWHSVFDVVEEKHLRTVAQMINDKGGITVKGQKYNIDLEVEDGKSTLDGRTAAANRLVYDKKVKFVVGPNAFFAVATSPIFESNKVLHVSGYNTCQPGEMDKTTPYGFLGYDASIGIGIAGIQGMKKEFLNIKKVAIVTPDDGALPYLIPLAKKAIEKQGITVVGDAVGYPNESLDMSPIASKLNAIKDADAILHQNGAPQHVGGIIKSLRELGNNKPYVGCVVNSCEDLLTIVGPNAGTNVITTAIYPHALGNPPLMDQVFDRSGGKPPIYLFIPNALWALTQAIRAADSIDPSAVKAKWESMDKIETLFGTGIMSGDQTYGIKKHAVGHPHPYQKLMNGKASFGGWVAVGAIP
jgi:branched-chain amino acid transport system substrate-binding protein